MVKKMLFFLVFLAVIPLSVSFTEYNQTGGSKGYGIAGATVFGDTAPVIPDVGSRGLTNAQDIQMVSDLNLDGTNEIIVNDAGTVKIYHVIVASTGINVNQVDSYTVGETTDKYSNMYVYDIDGNGYPNIILVDETKANMTILSYNTTFSLLSKFDLRNSTDENGIHSGDGGAGKGQMDYRCHAPNKCMVIFSNQSFDETGGTGNRGRMKAVPFNSTQVGNTSLLLRKTSVDTPICLPRIPITQVSDYDLDGNIEYIQSAYEEETGTNNLRIFYVQHNGMDVPTLDKSLDVDDEYAIISGNCDLSTIQSVFTSPLVADFDIGGRLETAIGVQVSSSTFRIYVYDGNGNLVNKHPNSQTGDGQMISNVVKINAFPNDKTGISDVQNDYCVLGFQQSTTQIDLLCGSMSSSYGLFDTIEYFDSIKNFNITTWQGEALIHSINSIDTFISNNNMDELLSTYGINGFSTDDCDVSGCVAFSCSTNNQCKMTTLFRNGAYNSVVVSNDYDKSGREDLIAMTNTSLYYIDDGFFNSPPVLCPSGTDCDIKPCNPMNQNATITATIRATDTDGDRVSYNMIFYYGDSNQFESGWTANVTSGTTLLRTGIANATIGSGSMVMLAMDEKGHTTSRVFDMQVVSSGGFNPSDCSQLISGSLTSGGAASGNAFTPEITDNNQNAISTPLHKFAKQSNIPETALFILIMIILAIYMGMHGIPVFVISGAEILLLVLGGMLGIISAGSMIAIVILSVLVIMFMLSTGRNPISSNGK